MPEKEGSAVSCAQTMGSVTSTVGMHDSSVKHKRSFYTVRLTSHDIGMKNVVFWDVTPCGSCKNRRFGGT
jgi:hypothetical protein